MRYKTAPWMGTIILTSLLAACSDGTGSKPVSSVDLSPPDYTMFVGETFPFSAVVTDVDGDVVQRNDLEWWTDEPSAARVTQQGVVTALDSGFVTVLAGAGRVDGEAYVDIHKTDIVKSGGCPVYEAGYPSTTSGAFVNEIGHCRYTSEAGQITRFVDWYNLLVREPRRVRIRATAGWDVDLRLRERTFTQILAYDFSTGQPQLYVDLEPGRYLIEVTQKTAMTGPYQLIIGD